MRVLQVSIQKQLEAFALQVSFVLASHGITVLWGASGSGKTTVRQSGSMRNGAYASRPNGGGSDMFFRTSGCSRICPCARICCSGGGSGARPGYRSKTW